MMKMACEQDPITLQWWITWEGKRTAKAQSREDAEAKIAHWRQTNNQLLDYVMFGRKP